MTRNRLMFDNNFEDLEKEKYPIWENACECVHPPARHAITIQNNKLLDEHNHTQSSLPFYYRHFQ